MDNEAYNVDIDLNYIGAIDREFMLAERESIQTTVIAICQKRRFLLKRNPKSTRMWKDSFGVIQAY